MAQKVKPIPEGHHSITPHLVIQGAAEAIKFYEKAFGAKVMGSAMFGPDQKTVMHAELKIGDSMIFLADEIPGSKSSSPKRLGGTTVSIHLYVDNVDAVYDRAVAAGAKPTMPLMNAFWGDRYGKLLDPYGHEWGLAQHIEDVSVEEVKRRAEEFRKQFAQK
jgi:PhnB protein